jgi:FtsZ-interacting cell division protein ZipA
VSLQVNVLYLESTFGAFGSLMSLCEKTFTGMENIMSILEIILIIVGIIVIIVSCILVDKSTVGQKQLIGKSISSLEESLTEEDKKQLMDKMKELLAEVKEEAIVETDDTLSKISNEKIMAVNEFSDQILEKIKRNHEEVVFLYNMLNDKEKELKAAVKEIDTSKKKVQDILEAKTDNDKVPATRNVKSQSVAKPSNQDKAIADNKQERPSTADAAQESSMVNGLNANNNSQILSLYSQGRSVIEISKLLGLGQGEVKLVIDLFKGKK